MADDADIREVFSRLLVHYFDRADSLPVDIRLILHLSTGGRAFQLRVSIAQSWSRTSASPVK